MRTKLPVSTCASAESLCVFVLLASPLLGQTRHDSGLLDECRREFVRGEQYYDHGELSQAEQTFESALAISNRLSGIDSLRGEVLNSLGILLVERGRFSEANECLSRALETLRGCDSAGCSLSRAKVVHNQGILHMQQNRPFEAERLLKQALGLYSRAHAGERENANVLVSLACLELDRGRPATAESYFRRALVGIGRGEGFNRTRALLYDGLSGALMQLNRPAEATEAAQMSLAAVSSDPAVSPRELVSHWCALARASCMMGDYARAERTLIHAQEVLRTLPEVESREHAAVLVGFAELRFYESRYPEAVEFQSRALETLRCFLSPDHPQMLRSVGNYAVMLRKVKRTQEAKQVEQELRAAQRRAPSDPGAKYEVNVSELQRR
jgi:tetratricopeptide (TPR) repeat protein